MEYVPLRSRDHPTRLISLVATADPARAAGLVRRRRREHPDEGLMTAVRRAAGRAVPTRATG